MAAKCIIKCKIILCWTECEYSSVSQVKIGEEQNGVCGMKADMTDPLESTQGRVGPKGTSKG